MTCSSFLSKASFPVDVVLLLNSLSVLTDSIVLFALSLHCLALPLSAALHDALPTLGG